MRARDVKTADEVTILGTELLGGDAARTTGVIQTLASWVDGSGTRVALRINAATPRSEADFFLLNLARARADAIVTTGAVLREESDVTHALQGPGQVPEALAAWRRRVVGLTEPAILLVLTSGRGLDPEHPAFRASVRPVLFVPEAAVAALEQDFSGRAQVVGVPAPSGRTAVHWLQAEGCERITVEAGPSTSGPLYHPPCVIEELWRSTYLEHELMSDVIGPAVVPDDELEKLLPAKSGGATVQEPSGPWRFERHRRSDGIAS